MGTESGNEQDTPASPAISNPSHGRTDPAYPPALATHAVAPANGLGTAGMILGIVGAALSLVPVLGFILGLLATIFGGIGLTKASRGEATNKGMAITGLVLGIITMAIWPVLIAIAAAGAAATG